MWLAVSVSQFKTFVSGSGQDDIFLVRGEFKGYSAFSYQEIKQGVIQFY